MKQLIQKISKLASGFFQKVKSFSPLKLLLIAYACIAIPFFVYHESHLPVFFIVVLTLVSTSVGLILTYCNLRLIQEYWRKTFHPILEVIAFGLLLFGLWLSDVFYFRAGTVFLFFLIFLVFLVRVLKLRNYAILLYVSTLILSNVLISFKSLQSAEILSAYLLFKNKYKFEEKDLSNWEQTGNQFWNSEIEMAFKLPDEFYFFKPNDLNLEEKTGVGQIAGVIASSDQDPNRYPSVRIFFFPDYSQFNETQADNEFSEYLKIQVNKQLMEDLQEINQKETVDHVLKSKFYTFYDPLRPRYAKTGYILLSTAHHDKILLHITENLEKGEIHETGIKEFLESISFRDPSQSDK